MSRCPRCRLQVHVCLCPTVVQVRPRTRIVVLRHIAEVTKVSNSARLAALAMPEIDMRDYGGREPAPTADLAAPGTALLYPAGPAFAGPAPARLVVLDGSWAQARRMYRKIDALRGMPTVHLTTPRRAVERLRLTSNPLRRSTLEAIADALAAFEGDAIAAPLYALYDELVRRSRASGRYPQRTRFVR
jgi:DTW domain-containing protein YfiP